MDVETLFSGQEKRHRAELTEKWKKLKDPSDVYAVSGARWIPFLDLHGTYLSCFTVQSVFNSPMIGHFGFVGRLFDTIFLGKAGGCSTGHGQLGSTKHLHDTSCWVDGACHVMILQKALGDCTCHRTSEDMSIFLRQHR